jgi:hypothetical protein
MKRCRPPWPPNVVNQLKQKHFDEAARQIGTDSANDFIQGECTARCDLPDPGQQGPPRIAQPVARTCARPAQIRLRTSSSHHWR